MFDSPLSSSAYEVLGVEPGVDDEALRRAYRLRLRQTHPDTGGDAAVFIRLLAAGVLDLTGKIFKSFNTKRVNIISFTMTLQIIRMIMNFTALSRLLCISNALQKEAAHFFRINPFILKLEKL